MDRGHPLALVCGLLNDRSVNKLGKRIVRGLVFGSVSALKSSVVLLLNYGVKPARGNAGLREQREHTQLASSHLLRAVL